MSKLRFRYKLQACLSSTTSDRCSIFSMLSPTFASETMLVLLVLPFISITTAFQPHHGQSPWKPSATWDPYCQVTGRPHYEPSPVVLLPSGPVIGTTTSLPSATAVVNKFLGLPFAQSPPERFSPPQDAAGWREPLNAIAVKPACIQQFNCRYFPREAEVYLDVSVSDDFALDPLASQQFTEAIFNTPAPAESEDCLYLNVFAPSTPAPKGGRAVMFW